MSDIFDPANGAPCPDCGAQVAPIDAFPGGYDVECYARREERKPLPTAQELARMWGGR